MGPLFPILIVIYIIVSIIKFIAKSKEQKKYSESEYPSVDEGEVFEEDPRSVKREDLADDFLKLLTGGQLLKPKKVGVVKAKPIEASPPPPAKKKIKIVRKEKELSKKEAIKKYLIPGVELTSYSLTNGIIMKEILSPPVAKRKRGSRAC